MLTTYANARNFSVARTTTSADADQRRNAALTAIGVLVPGEVIATATAISGFLSAKTEAAGGSATWTHLGLARALMLVLGLIAIPVLFRMGSRSWTANGWRGVALLVLTMISFAFWLALQPLTVYQGWLDLDAGEAAAIGTVTALLLGTAAGALGWVQARTEHERTQQR